VTLDWAEGVKLRKNVLVPMRDGVRLAADLYVPDAEGPWPAVLDYRPYRKDDEQPPGGRFYEAVTRRGYVVARVDVRGTGASEGASVDEYTLEEQLDGCEVIAWLASQSWCDGKVAMMGTSYSGFNAVQVAAHQPPELTTIIPIYFTDDRYTDDCHYRGGLMRKYFDPATYGIEMVAWNALPPYPEWSGEDWARIWQEHLEGNEPYILKWLRNQTDGPYWRNGSVREIADRITCPVFMIGGWRDGYPNTPLRLYEALAAPRRVLIGPWCHQQPDRSVPGPRIDYVHEIARWLDYWCKGIMNGVIDEPPVVVFMQRLQPPHPDRVDTVGEWRAESEWPPPGASETTLYLGESTLEPDEPRVGVDEFEYVPTVGVTGGLWSGGLPMGLAGDQRADEALSLTYTSAPLAEDIHVIGRPRAILHVSSTAAVIGFCASLAEVAPDGTSHLVAKGMLNATRRSSLVEPEPLPAGEQVELDIEIDATGWTFTRGNRIRLAVSSADWPNVWPTPEPALNRIYRGPENPSRLILPAVRAAGSAVPPGFLPSPHTAVPPSAALPPPVWEVRDDLVSGRREVRLELLSEQRMNATTVIERYFGGVSSVDPRDPAGASQTGRHVTAIVRPSERIEAESNVAIQASRTHFHVTLDLEVRVNGARYFDRRWIESIERQLL
jgi:predicted acyl esterase